MARARALPEYAALPRLLQRKAQVRGLQQGGLTYSLQGRIIPIVVTGSMLLCLFKVLFRIVILDESYFLER